MAADHAGFALKTHLANSLNYPDAALHDFGATIYDSQDDYPDFVIPLAKAVARGSVERGVAICGSGVGACLVANKIPGVRASVCHDTYSARQGVEHDAMNVLVLGARVIGPALALDILHVFLRARFQNQPRHVRRLEKLLNLERHS